MVVQAGDASGLALDATSLYFTTSDGTVQRRSKQGGGATSVATGQHVSNGFAISGVSLVWANEATSSINEMLTDDSGTQALVKAQNKPHQAAVSDSNLYWTNFGDNTVGVAQRDGSDVHLITSAGALNAVVGDSTNVYFSTLDGAVSVASVHGGEAQQIGKGPGGKVSLAIDATSIYWANPGDGAIIMMAKP
jgi:hypothetical protein